MSSFCRRLWSAVVVVLRAMREHEGAEGRFGVAAKLVARPLLACGVLVAFAIGRARRVLLVGCVVVAGGLALGASSAFAAVAYPFLGQLSGASFSAPKDIAVDDVSGQVLVGDASPGVVEVANASSGVVVGTWNGSNTPGLFSGPGGQGGQASVAVDQATGDVYVTDALHNVVDKFSSTGTYLCQITGLGSASTSASECQKSVAGPGALSSPVGVAVDQATGDVYVDDTGHNRVDEFDSSGNYVSQVTGPTGGSFASPHSVTVDGATGELLVADSSHDVYVFNAATGAYVTKWDGSAAVNPPGTPSGSFSAGPYLAADDTTGDVYVSNNGLGGAVDDLTSVGAYRGQITGTPSGAFSQPFGVGVDPATGDIYVGDGFAHHNVDVFGRGVLVPNVSTNAASGVQGTSATLNGHVDPATGGNVTGCRFEFVDAADYDPSAPNPYVGGRTASCSPAPPYASATDVSADVTGLTPGTTYHYRLEASNADNVPADGSDVTFSTPPAPSIDSASATNVTAGSAQLNAQINPDGYDTTYQFQWGTSTSYGNDIPLPPTDVGSGTADIAVTEQVTGLSANVEYHWRIVATNANGSAGTTADHTFIYNTSPAGLPDGRAYEQVTPVDKNGATLDNGIFIQVPAVSLDGNTVVAWSVQCFGDSVSCSVARSTEQGVPYEFSRTATGWTTASLSPSASEYSTNTPLLANPQSPGAALFSAPGAPGGADEFLARQPDGSFTVIGPDTPAAAGAQGAPNQFIATADDSHVVYWHPTTGNTGGQWSWPFDDTVVGGAGETTYEYVGSGNSQPLLVGVTGAEGSTDLISTCGTYPGGSVNSLVPGEMSADGATVFFTATQCASGGSGANAGVPVPANELWARFDQSRSVMLSARSASGCTSVACQDSVPEPAQFAGASSDGSMAYFTDSQQLTDGATQSSGNLYLYDFNNPAGNELIDASGSDVSGLGPAVQGVVAVSADGSHAYFVAQGVLSTTPNAEGQTAIAGQDNLYVYERDSAHPDGHVAFITTLSQYDLSLWTEEPNADVTPDGQFLVFASHGDLTSDDTSTTGARQVFRYDAQTGGLLRLSIGAQGFNDNGNAGLGPSCAAFTCDTDAYAPLPLVWGMRRDPAMSDDGSRVVFRSPVALTPQAINLEEVDPSLGLYAQNVYEWEQAGVGSCPAGRASGCVYLISDGKDATVSGTSQVIGTDANGSNIFFFTNDSLVPQDTDGGVEDIYDARIGGGFPYTPPSAPCTGDTCQSPPSGAPPPLTAASVTFSGPGNAKVTASPGRASVVTKVVTGSSFLMRIAVPSSGRITVAGAGIKTIRKVMSRAGTYGLRVTLTTKERKLLAGRHKLTLRIRVAYAPSGGSIQRASVRLTVKPGLQHRSRRSRAARRASGDRRGGAR